MGQSLSLLTAALLVGQTPLPQPGKSCNCNKAPQGYIVAQPEYYEAQPVGWFKRGSSSGPSTSEWRSASEPNRVDNRPVLTRVKGWFNRSDNGAPSQNEAAPMNGQSIIVQPSGDVQEYYRRLPTTNEPPLNSPIQRIAPSSLRPAPSAPSSERPLTIEVEPIDFRPAGQARGAAPALTVSGRPSAISARFANKVGQPGDYSWITGQLEIRNGTGILHYATPEIVDRYSGSLVLASDTNLSKLRSGDLVSAHGSVQHQGRSIVYRVQTIDLIER